MEKTSQCLELSVSGEVTSTEDFFVFHVINIRHAVLHDSRIMNSGAQPCRDRYKSSVNYTSNVYAANRLSRENHSAIVARDRQ